MGAASTRAITVALALVPICTEAVAAVEHAPHYRLYINALGGGDDNTTWFFPHCDYYDAGFREAIRAVADHAEPNAELSTEIDWVSKYYAESFGRSDLKQTLMRRGEACTQSRVCYVVVQAGRRYFLNQEALDYLGSRTPWHVEKLRGKDVVRVYRLERPDMPFLDDMQAAASTPEIAGSGI
jgi:hypothetical protein